MTTLNNIQVLRGALIPGHLEKSQASGGSVVLVKNAIRERGEVYDALTYAAVSALGVWLSGEGYINIACKCFTTLGLARTIYCALKLLNTCKKIQNVPLVKVD